MPSDAPRAAKGAGPGGDTSEGRRSKFVVLQQTINTLKSLQLRCAAQEEELARLRGGASAAPASASARPPDEPSELPAAMSGPWSAPGVEVREGSDARTCYVRVTCADRRGLLADILQSLRAMPVEVVRAAITTSADGSVNDCFELRLAPGAGGALRRDDIKRAVERQLLAAVTEGADDAKRRRTSSGTRAAVAAARR